MFILDNDHGGKMAKSKSQMCAQLLNWYDDGHRRMPWRAEKGQKAEAYSVWISEIMLQQTTVAAVDPYYRSFLKKWPTVQDLAAAELDEVLHAWQGLGYYSRARNLHKCAKLIVSDWQGEFPKTESELRTLPGIGPYTAAALAALVFGVATVPVDGNVERVMARLFAISKPLPEAKAMISKKARQFGPADAAKGGRPGDFAQALMELGATVCTPRRPKCPQCPWQGDCTAHLKGPPDQFPVKPKKKAKPVRYGLVYWVERSDGAVLIRRRPEKGLLGGMMEFPGSPWINTRPIPGLEESAAPLDTEWHHITGTVRHSFTHFDLELTILHGKVQKDMNATGNWVLPRNLGEFALPTLMKKVARHMGSDA